MSYKVHPPPKNTKQKKPNKTKENKNIFLQTK